MAKLVPYDSAFEIDYRQQLVTFIEENVPSTATIAQDKSVSLPDRTDSRYADSPVCLEQRIVGRFFAAMLTASTTPFASIRYVVVAEAEYGRFFLTTHRPPDGVRDRGPT